MYNMDLFYHKDGFTQEHIVVMVEGERGTCRNFAWLLLRKGQKLTTGMLDYETGTIRPITSQWDTSWDSEVVHQDGKLKKLFKSEDLRGVIEHYRQYVKQCIEYLEDMP